MASAAADVDAANQTLIEADQNRDRAGSAVIAIRRPRRTQHDDGPEGDAAFAAATTQWEADVAQAEAARAVAQTALEAANAAVNAAVAAQGDAISAEFDARAALNACLGQPAPPPPEIPEAPDTGGAGGGGQPSGGSTTRPTGPGGTSGGTSARGGDGSGGTSARGGDGSGGTSARGGDGLGGENDDGGEDEGTPPPVDVSDTSADDKCPKGKREERPENPQQLIVVNGRVVVNIDPPTGTWVRWAETNGATMGETGTASPSFDIETFTGLTEDDFSDGVANVQPSRRNARIGLTVIVPVLEVILVCQRIWYCDGTTWQPTKETRVEREDVKAIRRFAPRRPVITGGKLAEELGKIAVNINASLSPPEAVSGYKCR